MVSDSSRPRPRPRPTCSCRLQAVISTALNSDERFDSDTVALSKKR